MNHFEGFNYVDTDNTIHNTNFTTLNDALLSSQTFLPGALHSERWSCVCTGNLWKSTFFHQRDVKLWDTHDLLSFPILYSSNCQKFCFVFCSFCKIFTLYITGKKLAKLTVIQTSTVPHVSVLVSCTPNCLLCAFVLFGGRNDYPWTIP